MKNIIITLLLFCSFFSYSQQKSGLPEYEPSQLIVKLKDDVNVGIKYGINDVKSGISRNSIDKDLSEILGISQKIKKQEVLFSLKSVERSIIVRNENIRKQEELNNKPKTQGAQESDPGQDNQQFFSMKNVIKIEFEDPMTNIYEIIEELKDNLIRLSDRLDITIRMVKSFVPELDYDTFLTIVDTDEDVQETLQVTGQQLDTLTKEGYLKSNLISVMIRSVGV